MIEKKNKIIISILILFGLFFILLYNSSKISNSYYLNNYLFISIAFLIASIVAIIVFVKNNTRLFEPISVVSFIYFFMFVFFPLNDILENNLHFFGINIYGGTIKATIIASLGYLAFLFGYILKKRKYNHIVIDDKISEEKRRSLVYNAIFFYVIGFIGNLIYLMNSGISLSYIFTFSLRGMVNHEAAVNANIDFIGMFGFLMIPSWMILNEYCKNKKLIVLSYLIILMFFFIRGFRFVLVIILLAPLIYYYLKKNKSPSLKTIGIILMSLLLLISFVGMFRNDIRSGEKSKNFDYEDVIDNIYQSLYDNFGQYKTFYLMVEEVPQNYPYSLGVKTFINPIIMLIPRYFWNNKQFLGVESDLFLGQKAKIAGSAYPSIGELYLDFGYFSIIFMFAFGYLCGLSKKWINNNRLDLMKYSIFVPLLLQLTIRGYMASNFNLIIFILLPLFICSKIKIKK